MAQIPSALQKIGIAGGALRQLDVDGAASAMNRCLVRRLGIRARLS
jgi:hypothetical protein